MRYDLIQSLMQDQDAEITAMSKIGAALTELKEPEAVTRVLRWAVDKYRPKPPLPPGRAQNAPLPDIGDVTDALSPPREFQDFPALFNAASPATEPERALVAGYLVHVVQGQEGLPRERRLDRLKKMR